MTWAVSAIMAHPRYPVAILRNNHAAAAGAAGAQVRRVERRAARR